MTSSEPTENVTDGLVTENVIFNFVFYMDYFICVSTFLSTFLQVYVLHQRYVIQQKSFLEFST
uniref:Transmembrane protein n=1 Tax=Heterorhabditis bacteriophora TaxID=37862 RepID=A0A1I7XG29_HETBA